MIIQRLNNKPIWRLLTQTWNILGISLASARYTSVCVTGLTWKSLLCKESKRRSMFTYENKKGLQVIMSSILDSLFIEGRSIVVLTLYQAPCREWTALCLAHCYRKESSCCSLQHTRAKYQIP